MLLDVFVPLPDMIILRKSLFLVFTINLAALVGLPGSGGRVWLARHRLSVTPNPVTVPPLQDP